MVEFLFYDEREKKLRVTAELWNYFIQSHLIRFAMARVCVIETSDGKMLEAPQFIWDRSKHHDWIFNNTTRNYINIYKCFQKKEQSNGWCIGMIL